MGIGCSKFYMSLTLPTPALEVKTKQDLYEELEALSFVDARLQPRILDDRFFQGLPEASSTQLLDIGLVQEISNQYD